MSAVSFGSFVENMKDEIERLGEMSMGLGESMSISELGTSSLKPHNPDLENYNRSVRKITNNLTACTELEINKECSFHESALDDFLGEYFQKTNELSDKLDKIQKQFDLRKNRKQIHSDTKEQITLLKYEMVSFHNDLGELARFARLYGNIQSQAALLDDICDVVESIEKLLRQNNIEYVQTESEPVPDPPEQDQREDEDEDEQEEYIEEEEEEPTRNEESEKLPNFDVRSLILRLLTVILLGFVVILTVIWNFTGEELTELQPPPPPPPPPFAPPPCDTIYHKLRDYVPYALKFRRGE